MVDLVIIRHVEAINDRQWTGQPLEASRVSRVAKELSRIKFMPVCQPTKNPAMQSREQRPLSSSNPTIPIPWQPRDKKGRLEAVFGSKHIIRALSAIREFASEWNFAITVVQRAHGV
jgi:hypothetical protein